MSLTSLYHQDFFTWALTNASLIKSQQLGEVDFEHIAEELESMGKSQQRELYNRLAVLVAHLLKWQYQPERRGSSWQKAIKIQRIDIKKLLKDNPSLKSQLNESLLECYEKAKLIAETETQLEVFPEQCAYSLAQVLEDGFYPD